MKYQLIIFDLDGTLADTLADISDITNRTLSALGYPTHNQDEYRYFVGKGLKNLVINSLPEKSRTTEIIDNCYELVLQDYEKNYANKTKLYEGIPQLLNNLVNTNIKLAILSNKADNITKKICSKLLSNWHFEIIIGASNKFPRKPDPSSALYIANTLNVSEKSILYVGDSDIDMQTAKAAGFVSVGVTWGFRTKNELMENGATYIIDHPMDLLKFCI
jgi:phosphoglycolate phosphatase